MTTSILKHSISARETGSFGLRNWAVFLALLASCWLAPRAAAATPVIPVFAQCQEYFTATDHDLDGFVVPPINPMIPPPPCSDSFGTANITVRHVRLPFSFPCGSVLFSGLEGHGFAEFSRDALDAAEFNFGILNAGVVPAATPQIGLHVEIMPMPGNPDFVTVGSALLPYLKAQVYVQLIGPVADPDDYLIGSLLVPSNGVLIGNPVPFDATHLVPGQTGVNSVILDVENEIQMARSYAASTSTDCTIGVRLLFEPPSSVWQVGAQIGSHIQNRAQIIFY